jgi:hypothetical protein
MILNIAKLNRYGSIGRGRVLSRVITAKRVTPMLISIFGALGGGTESPARSVAADGRHCGASDIGIADHALERLARVDSGPYWQDREARLGVRVGEPHKAPFR